MFLKVKFTKNSKSGPYCSAEIFGSVDKVIIDLTDSFGNCSIILLLKVAFMKWELNIKQSCLRVLEPGEVGVQGFIYELKNWSRFTHFTGFSPNPLIYTNVKWILRKEFDGQMHSSIIHSI